MCENYLNYIYILLKFERYERFILMKIVNTFIVLVFSIEFFSFVLGYGTHYEHYKYGLMVSIILFNLVLAQKIKILKFQKKSIK